MAVSREKKTLVMFVALMLFGALCILGYIVVGHNWNYTATDLDDTFGDMEEYTVYVYEGTIIPEKSEDTSLADRVINRLNQWLTVDDETTATPEEQDVVEESAADLEELAKDGLSMREVSDAYRSKGAMVFEVDTQNKLRYIEGDVVQRNSLRVGFLGLFSLESTASVQEKINKLLSYGVQRVVVVTDDAFSIAGVVGVDIVIQAGEKAPKSWDFSLKGRYVTLAPQRGSIGVTTVLGSIAKTKVLKG